MPDFENTTPFGAFAIPSADREGRDLLLLVVAARFAIPPPGRVEITIHPTQEPPPRTDEYHGPPGQSSLKLEGQSAYTRPGTDIYVRGHASARSGRPTRRSDVTIQVGRYGTRFCVFGDRHWEQSRVHGLVPSPPDAFTRLPLIWERAFGGSAAASTPENPIFEARNPVGCGLQVRGREAIGTPLPNIEDPRSLLKRPGDRPSPVGTGPISRSWHPRAQYAGTYDEEWRRSRAPVWPTDFDERFFCAAPEALQARPHLRGGEHVDLEGLHQGGVIAFDLPHLIFASRSRFLRGPDVRQRLTLDGVLIDTDELELTLFYRTAIGASPSLVRHRETSVRLLEPWELPTP